MGEVKHLCLVRFKEGVVVEDVLKGMADLVAEMDMVKSFEWGQDVLKQEMLTQGFTHVFSLAFASADDLAAYMGHEKHAAFAATFMAALDKVLVIDIPVVIAKGMKMIDLAQHLSAILRRLFRQQISICLQRWRTASARTY